MRIKDIFRVFKTEGNLPDGQREGTAQKHFRWVENNVPNSSNTRKDGWLTNSTPFGTAGCKEEAPQMEMKPVRTLGTDCEEPTARPEKSGL